MISWGRRRRSSVANDLGGSCNVEPNKNGPKE